MSVAPAEKEKEPKEKRIGWPGVLVKKIANATRVLTLRANVEKLEKTWQIPAIESMSVEALEDGLQALSQQEKDLVERLTNVKEAKKNTHSTAHHTLDTARAELKKLGRVSGLSQLRKPQLLEVLDTLLQKHLQEMLKKKAELQERLSQAHAAAAAAEKEAVEMLSEELRVLEPSVSGTKAELEERLNHALTNQVLADEDEQNKRKRKPAEQQKDTQTEDCAFSSDCVIRIEKGKVMLKQLAEPKEVLMVSNIEELLDRVPGYHGLFIVMLKAPGKGYQKANAVYLGRADQFQAGFPESLYEGTSRQHFIPAGPAPRAARYFKQWALVDAMSRGIKIEARFLPIDGDIQTEYDHLLNTYDFAFNDDHNAGLRWPIVMNVNKDRKIDMYPVDKTCQELGAFAASILASTPGLAAYKEAVVKSTLENRNFGLPRAEMMTDIETIAPDYCTRKNVRLEIAADGVMLKAKSDLLKEVPDDPGTYIVAITPHGSRQKAVAVYVGKAEGGLKQRFRDYIHEHFFGPEGNEPFKQWAMVDAMSRNFKIEVRFRTLKISKEVDEEETRLLNIYDFGLNYYKNDYKNDYKNGKYRWPIQIGSKMVTDYPIPEKNQKLAEYAATLRWGLEFNEKLKKDKLSSDDRPLKIRFE